VLFRSEVAFQNFDSKLAANAIGSVVGQASSFVAGELIGGRSFAADLGRVAATSYLSFVLNDVAIDALAAEGFQKTAELLGGTFTDGTLTKKPEFGLNNLAGAIGGFLGAQLGGAIVDAPNTKEGQLVSAATSAIVGIVVDSILTGAITAGATAAATGAGAAAGGAAGAAGAAIGTFASVAIPFVGALIGVVAGNLIGSLFNDEDFPRAVAGLSVDGDGKLYRSSLVPVDGMDPNIIVPMVDAIVNSMNALSEGFGPDAGLVLDPSQEGSFGAIGYIATAGYRGRGKGFTAALFGDTDETGIGIGWNQGGGFDINDFESVAEYLIFGAVERGWVEGADAIGNRVFHYTEWSTLDELTTNLQIAKDYRSYLENREVIDRLVQEAPDSAFAAGWAFTIAQAVAFGFTDEFAYHVRVDADDDAAMADRRTDEAGVPVVTGTEFNDEFLNTRIGET